MKNLADITLAQLAAHRHTCDDAARPVLTERERAQSLATAMIAAKGAGRIEQARALAVELKPLMGWLK
jgi:hypothetical protein